MEKKKLVITLINTVVSTGRMFIFFVGLTRRAKKYHNRVVCDVLTRFSHFMSHSPLFNPVVTM